MKSSLLEFYMSTAVNVSLLSHAKKLKVGAIAVRDGRILSEGINGTPTGWMDNVCEDKIYESVEQNKMKFYPFSDENGCYRLTTKYNVIHAEANCIMKMVKHGQSAYGATLFCNIAPCIECSKLIVMAGFKQVYYMDEYTNRNAIEFLETCGIIVEKL